MLQDGCYEVKKGLKHLLDLPRGTPTPSVKKWAEGFRSDKLTEVTHILRGIHQGEKKHRKQPALCKEWLHSARESAQGKLQKCKA